MDIEPTIVYFQTLCRYATTVFMNPKRDNNSIVITLKEFSLQLVPCILRTRYFLKLNDLLTN